MYCDPSPMGSNLNPITSTVPVSGGSVVDVGAAVVGGSVVVVVDVEVVVGAAVVGVVVAAAVEGATDVVAADVGALVSESPQAPASNASPKPPARTRRSVTEPPPEVDVERRRGPRSAGPSTCRAQSAER